MSKPIYEGKPEFRPISAWGYVGYSILFAIPVIGQIFLIVFTFSGKNINRRSFARSYWIKALLWILLTCVLAVGFVQPFIQSVYGEDGTLLDLTSEIAAETDSALVRDILNGVNSIVSGMLGAPAGRSDGGTSAFCEMMDSYEAFIDEYVEFVKNLDEADLSDARIMADYTSMMARYAEVIEKLDAIDEDDLTPEEEAYYIEVMARIEKKLLELN